MKIELIKGDITGQTTDVIVNAANSSLLGGGGVDGAIHRAGGPEILEDCKEIRAKQGKCKTGEAVITGAGNLNCKRVIHTVGPVYNNGGEKKEQQLRNCYINSLDLMVKEGFSSISFPNISTGIYRFPKAEAAQIAIEAVKNYEHKEKVEQVVFVCFDDENHKLYEELLE